MLAADGRIAEARCARNDMTARSRSQRYTARSPPVTSSGTILFIDQMRSSSTIVLIAMLSGATILRHASGHMRGAKTPEVNSMLSLFAFGCFIPAAIFRHWTLFFSLPFVWLLLINPIARYIGAYLAVWINRRGSGGPFEKWVGLPPRRFTRLLELKTAAQAQGIEDITAFMRAAEQHDAYRNAALDIALGQPSIQLVLRQYDATRIAETTHRGHRKRN